MRRARRRLPTRRRVRDEEGVGGCRSQPRLAAPRGTTRAWDVADCAHVQLARDAGALSVLPFALAQRSACQLFAGELDAAASLLEEIAGGRRTRRAAAWHRTCAAGTRHLPGPRGGGHPADRGRREELVRRGDGRGLRFISLGDRGALQRPRPLRGGARPPRSRPSEDPHASVRRIGRMVELIEAAARSGTARARRRCPPAGSRRQTARERHGLGTRDRGPLAGACSAREDAAEPLRRGDREARSHPGARSSSPAPTCSTASGCDANAGALDAREQLRTAHDLFTEFGMEAFAERAAGRAARRPASTPASGPPRRATS